MTENGQQVQVDDPLSIPPGDVIRQLMQRIADLTMELAIKSAYIDKLESDRVPD